MARISVPRERFRAGDFPEVCVMTGDRADDVVEVRFDSTPDWTWILLIFGVLPFLVASWFATERVEGQLPVAGDVVHRYHARRRQGWLTAGAAGILFLLAAVNRTPVFAWIGLVAIVVAAVLGIRAYFSFVNGRPTRSGEDIELVRVHPRFARAIEGDASSMW